MDLISVTSRIRRLACMVKPIERIVVGAQVLRQPAMPSKGAVEHPTECDAIDRARVDAEPNDPARVLIHDDQDPVGPQRGRLAPEQIYAPEAVFHVAQERQPGGTARGLSWPVVMCENPSNHVFVDGDVERQGNLLCDSRTAPVGITLLHFDDRMNEFCTGRSCSASSGRSWAAALPTCFRARGTNDIIQPASFFPHWARS